MERCEVVWGKHLSLGDREVDLNLVEPTGMVRRVNQPGVGPLLPKAVDAALPAVNGSIVDDPEDPSRRSVGPLTHDVSDEMVKGDNSRLGHAAAEDFGAVNIPGCDVGQGTLTEVLVFETHGSAGCGACGGILPSTCLDAGLFVGTDNKVLLLMLGLPAAATELVIAPPVVTDDGSAPPPFGDRVSVLVELTPDRS